MEQQQKPSCPEKKKYIKIVLHSETLIVDDSFQACCKQVNRSQAGCSPGPYTSTVKS